MYVGQCYSCRIVMVLIGPSVRIWVRRTRNTKRRRTDQVRDAKSGNIDLRT